MNFSTQVGIRVQLVAARTLKDTNTVSNLRYLAIRILELNESLNHFYNFGIKTLKMKSF